MARPQQYFIYHKSRPYLHQFHPSRYSLHDSGCWEHLRSSISIRTTNPSFPHHTRDPPTEQRITDLAQPWVFSTAAHTLRTNAWEFRDPAAPANIAACRQRGAHTAPGMGVDIIRDPTTSDQLLADPSSAERAEAYSALVAAAHITRDGREMDTSNS